MLPGCTSSWTTTSRCAPVTDPRPSVEPVETTASRGAVPVEDPARDVRGIAPRAADEHRVEAALEEQTHEVETGEVLHDAAFVPRPSVVADGRRVDEGEVLAEAGAPHDVRDIEHRAVGEHRSPVDDVGRAFRHVANACVGEVVELD